MRIVFMGTPEFAVPALQVLVNYSAIEVVGVVTQPDRPVGRKRLLTPTPVKEEAIKHGIPVLQPEKLRRPESVEELRELQPDLIVTAAYGQILPKSVLAIPRLGCINIHASLLPRYRGGAPIHHAVMNGDTSTGVTIMYMAEGLDTGDMISSVELAIRDSDTTGTMFNKLSAAGAQLLLDTLPDLLAGRIQAVAQNHEAAVYSPNVSREQERIDWSRPAISLWNQVRGLNPRPGAYTTWNGEVLKIWSCDKPNQSEVANTPGTVVAISEQGIQVATGTGILTITELQPAGKKAMQAAQFVLGGRLVVGTVFV
ncbi:methionyl-tRNA formyltransferase [Paenibacillus sp. FSL H7-0331]|uniref:methionyl-tRNA formyltransferase n=1 Tax=Paenibacillus sp. FSL H7-0331 TaxID=1920421 RepID=UPI00096CF7B6|nr:methionyl-tRNA formyltransferase [Paenibacillus sp. FSL H7-0331]OMF14541.1 methionyl-tRNA formyltransferase [Paenibacillus sp. FSL H7-0331]